MSLDKKLRSMAALGGIALASALPLKSQVVTQYTPFQDDQNATVLKFDLTNNNDGAVYDSAALNTNLFSSLYNAYSETEKSNLGYTSLSDFVTKVTTASDFDDKISFTFSPDSVVKNGWNATTDNAGLTYLNNVGGVPNVTYDSWSNGNTLSAFYSIGKNLLDTDGNGTPNYSIGLSYAVANQPNIFTANGLSVDTYSANGLQYSVGAAVPEPSAFAALAGLLALGYSAVRRKNRKE